MLRLIQYGPAGIVISIFHITIPVILLFLLFQAHVIGAGDIKLFSITGIFLTTEQLLKVMLLSFFIAAIYGAGKIGYLALKGKKMQDIFKVVFLYFLSGTSADLKFDQNVDRVKAAEKMYQIDC